MEKSPAEYEAPNRGEQVESSNQDFDYSTDADTTPSDFPQPDWSEDNPIPVYVVQTPEIPQLQNWSSERFIIVDSPIQLAGSRRNRTRVVIRNEGPDPVFIDPEPGVNSAFSSRLKLDEREEMFHNMAVWARCDTGKTATVSLIQEYDVSLDGHRV